MTLADARLLVAAGWLHDIGYSPTITDTGFHPLDGARHLQQIGAPTLLCQLVAHHACALVEARLRRLGRYRLDEFPVPGSSLLDALTHADLATSPTGEPVTVHQRLDEILNRYPRGHVVHRAITIATLMLLSVEPERRGPPSDTGS